MKVFAVRLDPFTFVVWNVFRWCLTSDETRIKHQQLHKYQSRVFSRRSSRHCLQVLLAAPLMLPGRYAIASLSETHRENTPRSIAEYRMCLCLPPPFFLCVWSHIDSCYHAALALLASEAWWSNLSVFMADVKPQQPSQLHGAIEDRQHWGPVYFSGWCLDCFHNTSRGIHTCMLAPTTACFQHKSKIVGWFAAINCWAEYLMKTAQLQSVPVCPKLRDDSYGTCCSLAGGGGTGVAFYFQVPFENRQDGGRDRAALLWFYPPSHHERMVALWLRGRYGKLQL